MTRKIYCIVLFVILLTYGATIAQALETIDMGRKDCSLTVEMRHDYKPVSGGTLTLYRVGNIISDGDDVAYTWMDDLNCEADPNDYEFEETVAKALECINNRQLTGKTEPVDDNGEAVFNNLEVGLYLIKQDKPSTGFRAIKPAIVSLPQWDDNRYVYSVVAIAKTEKGNEPHSSDITNDGSESTSPGDNGPGGNGPGGGGSGSDSSGNTTSGSDSGSAKNPEIKLPQTGQLNWPVPLFFVMGVTFLIIGRILQKRKKDE